MQKVTGPTKAVPVIALLAGVVAVPLVAPAGSAVAGSGTIVIGGTSSLDPWTYGDSLSYQADLRLTQGRQVTATSSTPQICKVATDGQGAPTGALQMVDVGGCTVSFHLEGDATHAPYDAVVSRMVKPRDLRLSCRDAQRASDEPNPDLIPVFANLAPGDSPSDFVVRAGPTPRNPTPGRWPVSLVAASTVNPTNRAPRYVISSTPCTLTVNPVLKVTGMPAGKAANLTVDGKAVDGNRYVFPYGSTASYSVSPVLGAVAPIPPALNYAPDAWFANTSTGSATGDTTVTYLTFDDLLDESPFHDFYKSHFMSYTFGQYGWLAARQNLSSGYNGVSEETRLRRLRLIVGDLQNLIKSTVILYLGRPDYDAVKASGDELVAYLQLIRDSGGVTTR